MAYCIVPRSTHPQALSADHPRGANGLPSSTFLFFSFLPAISSSPLSNDALLENPVASLQGQIRQPLAVQRHRRNSSGSSRYKNDFRRRSLSMARLAGSNQEGLKSGVHHLPWEVSGRFARSGHAVAHERAKRAMVALDHMSFKGG